MKRNAAFFTLFLVMALLFLVFFVLWDGARNELKGSTIMGRAYQDRGALEALDRWDEPATGLKVQLYRGEKGWEALVEETEVDEKGIYVFRVKDAGEYNVKPVTQVPGYPAWGWVTILHDPGNIVTEEGGLYSGPIFLLSQYTG